MATYHDNGYDPLDQPIMPPRDYADGDRWYDDEVVRNAPLWVKALAFLCASALVAAPVAALIWAFS